MKCFLPLLLLLLTVGLLGQNLQVINLRCEYLADPVGIDVGAPRLSWQLQAGENDKNVMQTAWQVQASTSADSWKGKALIWDSKKQNSDQSVHNEYEGPALKSRQRVYWRVKTWDNQGRESEWSRPAFWEMGLLSTSDWTADWIRPDLQEEEKEQNPAPMLRREFALDKNIAKARLYITSHGLYEAQLNGKKVGDELFTPGWTSYKKRLQYQTYDVTDLLQAGQNAIGVTLGDGWYRGPFGWADNWNVYGDKLALLCQLEVEYKNGKKEIITSDTNWKASTGPIRMSGLYDGEIYDARMKKKDWSKTGYSDADWKGVIAENYPKDVLIAPQGVPVKRIEEVKAKKIFTTPEGDVVVDMGQNMVGWIKLKVQGKAGDVVTLHHAEVLDKDGNFYTANLRSADQKVQYTLAGNGEEVYEPHFTFQGFRYVKVDGFSGQLGLDNITGVVIHSDMEPSGSFECSSPLLNQLQSNIQWGQKGNFLDVPTDCPQRDERMGWTGDAQAFAPTACYNFNTAAFYTKWLGDVKADQNKNGSVPFVVPDVLGGNGSIGWGDVATILPWTMYLKYGDERILEVQYESMRDWVDFLKNLAGNNLLVQDGFHFGDWLFFIHPTDWNDKPGYTDTDVLATAFLAHSADLVAKAAGVLGKTDDAKKYGQLRADVKKAFQHEFMSPSGRLSSHSQTAYALALAFDLIPENMVDQAVNYLVQDIEKRNFHLSTGFLGTPHLCHVLSKHGHTDVAYKLLNQTTYPSWLYPVTRGATTIWERWDGIKPDSSFQSVGMNSFNHYAYGAIGDWMYSVAAGLSEDAAKPGYKHIVFQPHPDTSLTYAKAEHQSLYGKITSGWKLANDSLLVQVSLPPNTTGTLHLPQMDGKTKTIDLGSGAYAYSVPWKVSSAMATPKSESGKTFSTGTTLGELWKNETTKAVLLKHIPELASAPQDQLSQGFPYSLKMVSEYAPEVFTKEKMEKIDADLRALK